MTINENDEEKVIAYFQKLEKLLMESGIDVSLLGYKDCSFCLEERINNFAFCWCERGCKMVDEEFETFPIAIEYIFKLFSKTEEQFQVFMEKYEMVNAQFEEEWKEQTSNKQKTLKKN